MMTSPSRGQRNALASFIVAAILWPGVARAGSARDYLNAPVDTWLLTLNAGYTTSVTPEDGTDTVPGVRSNVFAQSVVLTRVMDLPRPHRRPVDRPDFGAPADLARTLIPFLVDRPPSDHDKECSEITTGTFGQSDI
jgi:hypothetical protein